MSNNYKMGVLEKRVEELRGEFADLREGILRYSLLLRLSAFAPQPSCSFATDENLFRGCQTRLWLSIEWDGSTPDVQLTSDSMLIRGVCLVLIRLLSGLPPEEYRDLCSLDIPAAMGLGEMFTKERRQGIGSLLSEIERRVLEKNN